VARAFNAVHREAVRVAAEQAALHTSVSVMFLNLARRSQSLVDLMIGQLDDMERDEEDPKRLSRLFRLDHLATRMRRNDENLLVLAGADSSPARREDVVLADVLRAAQAEIENYDRVEFASVEIDALVAARAVNDVVRLLAELLDNSTRFSPPNAVVLVSARQLADYVLIQIEDHGVGINPEQVAFFNTRLAAPPTMDITAFRMMGLAVVGRLAGRYGIQIELHGSPGRGTTVYIKLPGPIIILRRSLGPYGYSPNGGGMAAPLPRRPLGVPAGLGGDPRWSEMGSTGGTMTAVRPPMQMPYVNGSDPYAAASPPVAAAPAPSIPDTGTSAWTSRTNGNDDTAEMPIYREVEAAWFRESRPSPMAGVGPLAGEPRVASAVWDPPPPSASSPPPPPEPASWRTAADDGWRAARSAAEVPVRTQTRTGLPKRVPQAQLVPGGVGDDAASAVQRNPEEVRGLLSAYHRGVQRGRGIDDAAHGE
jgi:hypothetical protein